MALCERTSAFYRRRFTYLSCIFVGFFNGLIGLQAFSQEQGPLPPSGPQKVVSTGDLFSTDLEILSRRLKVAFVAEGEPFPRIEMRSVPTLNVNMTPENAVREVADYFDYDAVLRGNVYLLTKRYTNSDDLPNVTAEECRIGLKTVCRILATFNPKYPKSKLGYYPQAQIGRLLTADQLSKLGARGLPVSELTPEQHAEASRLAFNFFIQLYADPIDKGYEALQNRNPADPFFHWQTIMDIHAFGYEKRSVYLNNSIMSRLPGHLPHPGWRRTLLSLFFVYRFENESDIPGSRFLEFAPAIKAH